MKRFLTHLLLAFCPFIQAQHLNESLGNLKEFKKTGSGVRIIASNAILEASVYSASTVRIRIYKEEAKDFSYAVTTSPLETRFTVKEEQDRIEIRTDSILLSIQKTPLRVRFYNKLEQVLNEDDPSFGTSWIGNEATTYKRLQKGERFIGLGEKTGNLDRRGRAYVNWNNDYYAYPVNGDPLYQSTPFYIGIHNQRTYGVFFDNSYRTTFNFGASNDRFSSFATEDGEMNYYLIGNSNIPEIIRSYTQLTGRTEMPPLWSLGFQQCRYSYYPYYKVMAMARNFRERSIPADVIYFDIHYMDAYKVFSWDTTRFPDPIKMLKELKELGFHVVVIIDPGIKVEEKYEAYMSGLKDKYFVRYPDDSVYTAEVWPSWSHFPDFTNPKVREWWGTQFKNYVDQGVEGFWNDMNEPASWGNKPPDLLEFDYEGNKSTHKRAHNVYGMQMARATAEGTKKLMNGKRPFILTRAGYSGIQRYSSVWTGDNVASDEHMLLGVRLVNSMGISGIPFTGPDVGGFAGEPSPELYQRWMSIGAFTPFFRVHSMIGSKDREPWSFGEDVEANVKSILERRYQLLPYLYSSFFESSLSGMPINRSLSINYTHDPYVYLQDYQNEFLFGPSILVAPVTSTQRYAKIYLPEGSWYKWGTDEKFKGKSELITTSTLDSLPVFVKEGAIIPMQSTLQYTTQKTTDTLYVHLYNGKNRTTFTYYEDDGETYDYKQGKFLKAELVFDGASKIFSWNKKEGSVVSKFKKLQLIWHGFDQLKLQDKSTKLTSSKKIKTATINLTDSINIKWQ